ncbi:hypothetical protein [Hymenobacter chitinivorans]|uniref:Uncharacterized protein n=1 Tax=Hymenobacter chitinivorans DSM 11115 TaxID=1121954 RepID=A0A2M9B5F9_9BACT|nr:hypothetical protein [Hymenobacter chitinivorans]PJJ53183.1 hypothetical protein CLV45_3841 [Hymenobacter chitinivorans DSM 11115]
MGFLYFYDKQTHRTHYADATCGTLVWKQDGQYHVLASLAHMMGSAGSAVIPAPEKLPLVSVPRIAAQDGQYSFPSSVPNPAVHRVFPYKENEAACLLLDNSCVGKVEWASR